MKKTLSRSFILIFFSLQSFSQLLSCTPDFVREGTHSPLVIRVHLAKGTRSLLNSAPVIHVYIYKGVMTNRSVNLSERNM